MTRVNDVGMITEAVEKLARSMEVLDLEECFIRHELEHYLNKAPKAEVEQLIIDWMGK